MDESLTERRRVRDEGLRVVNRCQLGGNAWGFSPVFDRFSEEGRAKFVPAAAVTRTVQTLFGITGLKACVGGLVGEMWKPTAQPWNCVSNPQA